MTLSSVKMHTVHYSQFSLDDMCMQKVHVCVLPHLAENIDGFVLIEEPHDDTNILLLKSKIEVQQYIQLMQLLTSSPSLLPTPLPSRHLLSFFPATSLPPSYPTNHPSPCLLYCSPPYVLPLSLSHLLTLPTLICFSGISGSSVKLRVISSSS